VSLTFHLKSDDLDFNEVFAEYFINEFDDPLNAYTSSMANYSSVVANDGSAPLPSAQPSASLPTGGIRTSFHSAVPQQLIPPAAKKAKTAEAVVAASLGLPAQPVVGQSMALPVGVGIRLGGIGGIAPATAQARPQNVQQHQFSMWGGTGREQGGASHQIVAERRQRNREHAKRSRVRKKFMLESLQAEVLQLQKENQHLRMLVQEHIPEKSMEIIAECSTGNPLFDDDSEQNGVIPKPQGMEHQDFSLVQSLTSGQKCFVLSDPKLPDNPIVFASPGFYEMTGYTSKEVLGRNCRFLQGPGTDPKAVDVIRKAVATGTDATVCLLNYKADGTPFWNQFFMAALRDSDNNIVNYVSTCSPATEAQFLTLSSYRLAFKRKWNQTAVLLRWKKK